MDKRRFWMTVMFLAALLDLFLVLEIVVEWNSISGVAASAAPAVTPAGFIGPVFSPVTLVARSTATRVPARATAAPTTTATASRTALPPKPTVKPSKTATHKPSVPTATVAPVATAAPVATSPAPVGPLAPAQTLTIALPSTLRLPALTVNVPAKPLQCTHASAVPAVVTTSLKLCPGESYGPILLRGNNIGLFQDDLNSARITASGRTFGVTLEGSGLFVGGLTIRVTSDPADEGIGLCKYTSCEGRHGGVTYGGGVLVHASNSTVMNTTVLGGIIGIAIENQRQVMLIDNHLDGLSGWGSYNLGVNDSYFVGNSLDDDNRFCTADGSQHDGCESAGLVCISCQSSIFANNTCSRSGDCYYLNGEGNFASNNNRFHSNQCQASPHNCFEVTFSVGNEFIGNSATGDPVSGQACLYPFWIGGSQVLFGANQWSCIKGPDRALSEAMDSTSVTTSIQTVPPSQYQ